MTRANRFSSAAVLLALGLVATVRAEVKDADREDVAWFAGQWATGPIDRPGHETLGPAPDCSRAVTIRVVKGNVIARVTRLRDGSLHQAEFAVKRFGQNFPWWSTDGGPNAPMAKRTGDDVFVLARTSAGRADWNTALQHRRCKPEQKS